MKPYCKCKTLLAIFVAGLLTIALPSRVAIAQSAPKPAVVISLANVAEQVKDVEYILKASGFAQFKFMVKALIQGYTKGFDADKAAGVLLTFNDSEIPDFLGFAPLSDIEELLDVLATVAEVDESDDHVTIVTDDGTEIIVKEHNGYAFFSNQKSNLESLPDNPAAMLDDLPDRYNLAAQVYGQRIPQSLRDKALETIRESGEMTLQNLDDGIQSELQQKNLEMQLQQMEMVFTQTDRLLIGMSIDADGKRLLTDVEFTALPGTKLAKRIAQSAGQAASKFTGFLMDGAAFTHNQTANLAKEEAENYSNLLDDLKDAAMEELNEEDLSEEEMTLVEDAVGDILDVMKQTMTEGIIDSGAVIMLKDGEINMAAGLQVADPKKLEGTVKKLAAMAEEKMGDEIEINLNSGSHKNATFHQFVLQVPDDEEEMRDALGDQVELIVGVGSKELYLAAGSNPTDLLKKCMDSTNSPKDMVQYNVFVTPILDFAAQMEGDPTVEAMAKALKEAGNDKVSVVSNLIENGLTMRFEMEDGILGLIKVGYDAMQGNFDDDF